MGQMIIDMGFNQRLTNIAAVLSSAIKRRDKTIGDVILLLAVTIVIYVSMHAQQWGTVERAAFTPGLVASNP